MPNAIIIDDHAYVWKFYYYSKGHYGECTENQRAQNRSPQNTLRAAFAIIRKKWKS